MTTAANLTAGDVTRAVWSHFAQQSWAGLAEVTAHPGRDEHVGWTPGTGIPEEQRSRRIDLLLLRPPRKTGIGSLERLAIEVKVSRSDFLTDVRNPHKQARWRELAHRHAFAVPDGLVDPSEIPDGSGLLTVSTAESWRGVGVQLVKWAKRAPYTDTNPDVPAWLAMNLAYRASWAESKAKGWLDHGESDPETLRLENERLRKELSAARNKIVSLTEQRDEWRRLAGLTVDAVKIPCVFCGQPIVARNMTMRYGIGWKHADKAHDDPCAALMTSRYDRVRPADDFNPAQLAGVNA